MQTVSNYSYISNRQWMQDAVNDEDVILRGVSALEYLRLFVGYLNESEIDVYAKEPGYYENVRYHIVDNFEDIEFFNDGEILCSTLNQAVNDILDDLENEDDKVLVNALSNYYYSNEESFDGLYIRPENIKVFESIRDWAIEYYDE